MKCCTAALCMAGWLGTTVPAQLHGHLPVQDFNRLPIPPNLCRQPMPASCLPISRPPMPPLLLPGAEVAGSPGAAGVWLLRARAQGGHRHFPRPTLPGALQETGLVWKGAQQCYCRHETATGAPPLAHGTETVFVLCVYPAPVARTSNELALLLCGVCPAARPQDCTPGYEEQ